MNIIDCLILLFILNISRALQPLIWPLPQQYTISDGLTLNINSSQFQFIQNQHSDIITNAFSRYMSLCFPHIAEGSDHIMNTITKLDVNIKDGSENTLAYGMDESYSLSISISGTAILTSNTVWGALRGLETFSQIVIFNTTLRNYQTYTVSIYDTPRFSHRGLLIDTSRHFQSLQSIKNVLDGLSYNKFNVLHWHITDTQSFPYQSLVYPKLWDAAYSNTERFTQNDVKDIINFAKQRGIRVIPEFDMPGHAQSWCTGYPSICPSPKCNTPLNPANNFTWELLTGVIEEAAQLFIDDHIHLGGDEVKTGCWNNTPSIVEWMNENNFTEMEALQYFDEKVIEIANNNNKTVVDWDEVFTAFNTTLDPTKIIIQVWDKHSINSVLPEVVAAGFRAIFSPDKSWYLDQISLTWQDRYVVEPFQDISNLTQQSLVIGGEACMWGETVDVSDIQQTIWPTASAVAERLWSAKNVTNITNAERRIEYFRCLMNRRGIQAAPTNNNQSRSAPPRPGSCYLQ